MFKIVGVQLTTHCYSSPVNFKMFSRADLLQLWIKKYLYADQIYWEYISSIRKVTSPNIPFMSLLSFFILAFFFRKETKFKRSYIRAPFPLVPFILTVIQRDSLVLKNSWNARVFLISCWTVGTFLDIMHFFE